MAQILALPRRKVAKFGGEADPAVDGATHGRPKGIGPCLFYLTVEFGRPMAWFPFLVPLRLGLIAALWGLVAVIRHRARPIPRPVWYMFGLAAVMAWNVPWAMNNAWALWGFQDFIILVAGFVVPLAVLPASLGAVRYLLNTYFFLHVIMAIHGIMHGGRGMSGWMGDENDLALALNIAIGLGIYLYLESASKTKKLLVLISMGVMIAGVVASLSRGGFVGLASLGLFVLLTGPHRVRVLLCIALAAAGLVLFAPPGYWDEVQSIKTAGDEGDTGEQRMYLWGMAWRMYLDHPIVGVGTRNYGIRAPYYEDLDRSELGGYHVWGRVCHSLYFTLIAEQGTLGTLLFLAVVGWCVKTLRKLRRAAVRMKEDPDARSAALLATGLFAGIFAYLVTGAFLTVIYYPLLWVLAGLLAALDATAPVPPKAAA